VDAGIRRSAVAGLKHSWPYRPGKQF